MALLRSILLVGGVVAALFGLLFLGQGTGVFPFPRSSAMVGQTAWAYRGITLTTVGCVLTMVSRGVGRR